MSVSSMGTGDYIASTTELDSHVNMIVMGKQAFLLSNSVQSVDVKAFPEVVDGLYKVPIVDAVIAYNFPHTGETLLIVLRNFLCVLVMDHNLFLTFILHEAGLVVNNTPKFTSMIQVLKITRFLMWKPDLEYHSGYQVSSQFFKRAP